MDVLIIKLGAIGDVIRTTSVLQGLKAKYKGCKIDWVTKKESFDVLKNNKLIGKIYLIGNAVNRLKKSKYDLLICLDDDNEACELASKIGYKKIIGSYFDDKRKTYTKDSSLWFDMGLISRFDKQKADELKAENRKTYQEIIYKILNLKYHKQEPILVLNKKELDFGKKFAKKNKIKKSGAVIGINTGAGGRWQDKKLSIEKTAELIDKLNSQIKNIRLILFGGPEEVQRNKQIKCLIQTKIIDAGCNNSLIEFASLVNLCNVLVTSDSLALHIGTALKKKIIVFFCPTSPSEIEMYQRGIKVIPKIGCLCCYKPKCDITPEYDVDKIINAVKKLMPK
ncbi:glycosyltransferase family 9 protein [Candidatus Woesearchaeota archaeon]|nr:glycosyltransferase family 9 protein [Candidatus Woesearchaeota archaeon]